MSDLITVQGVVLSDMPVGDYDKRIVLLTRERGKISAFAKGARRQNSPFMAAANPFVFGSFTLYEGRTSYNLNQVSVQHIEDRLVRCIYELRTMVIQGVMPQLFQCAGCGRELTEEETGELFFSQDEHGILFADCSRMVMDRKRISAAALYAMRYIAVSPLAKLYTFTVRDDVLRELERHIYRYTELNTDKRFKSLEILELMR